MTKLNTFTKSLFVVALFAGANVNASELTTQLKADAAHSLTVTMEENLNQVALAINGAVQKDLILASINTQTLVLDMAANVAVQDVKATTSVSE